MQGKLNGVTPATTPKWLAHRPVVDAGRYLVGVVALQQLRHATGEFDDVDAARDLALCIGEDLAMFGGDHRGQRVLVLIHQLEKLVEDARAADRRHVAPGRLRCMRCGDCRIDFVDRSQRNLARHRAAGRMKTGWRRPLLLATARPLMKWPTSVVAVNASGAPMMRSPCGVLIGSLGMTAVCQSASADFIVR